MSSSGSNRFSRTRGKLIALLKRTRLLPTVITSGNIVRFGFRSPRFGQKIWINPQECYHSVDPARVKPFLRGIPYGLASGIVLTEDIPFKESIPVEQVPKVRACIEHWVRGVPWKDTGVFQHMKKRILERGSFDGCSSEDDILARYENLDSLFETIKSNGTDTLTDLQEKILSEDGGIRIHIGPKGKPYLGLIGCHRFAIALILGLNVIPARIGLIHINALGLLPNLKKNRKQ